MAITLLIGIISDPIASSNENAVISSAVNANQMIGRTRGKSGASGSVGVEEIILHRLPFPEAASTRYAGARAGVPDA